MSTICSICNNPVEIKKNEKGKVYWSSGNNAKPINSGRCCDNCNWDVVLPARLKRSLDERGAYLPLRSSVVLEKLIKENTK